MRALEKINGKIEKLFTVASVILLTIFIFVVFIEVIARNVIKVPIIWSTEVSLMTFIWSVFLGSAIAVRKKRHYIVEIFPEQNFETLNVIFDIVADLAIFGIIYVMIFNGITFAKMGLTRYSTSLGLPQTYFFACIPVSGIAMAFFGLELLIKDIKRLSAKVEKEVSV